MANTIRIILSVLAFAIVAVIVVVLVILLRSNDSEIIVKTNSGLVKGIKIQSDISNFNAFFSIPYAEPPVDEFRFKTTSPVNPWEGTHDGTTEGPACIQSSNVDASEDCLTLTIYTSEVQGEGKAVYVWLHGGALEFGSAKMEEYGPHYLMQHDLIVVTVQFRLGMLGFLNLYSEDAPGNMGLADSIEALKWIQNNIEYFGGDFNRVTVGGLSSGGIMVHALLLSPQAHGLFKQVIINSGTALSYRFYHSDNEPPITKTKEVLNMIDSSNDDLILHLKKLNTSELLDITAIIKRMYPTGYATYYPYAISRDYFGIIPETPMAIIQNNSYNHLPMLIGMTSNEGIRLETSMNRLDFVNDHFYMVVPTALFPIDDITFEKNQTASRIKEFYFGDKDLSQETFIQYTKLCTDSWYGHITDYLIRLQGHLNYSSNIYYYMFAVDGAYNMQKIQQNITTAGASHGDDIGYIWRVRNLENIIPEDDFSDLARDRLVALWSNFIKTGDPTPEVSSLTPVKWETVEYPDVKYLLINKTQSMQADPFRERLLFWQQLYGWTEL